jgi:hypothetical protein
MPWTIPNLLLRDKPVPLANMRSHGRNRVFVCCSNPACHHNAELDVIRKTADETFNALQPRMLAQCAIIAVPTLARRGGIMADWSREFDEPISLPNRKPLVTLRVVASLPEAEHSLPHWQMAIELLMLVGNHADDPMLSRIAMMQALNHGKPVPKIKPEPTRAKVYWIER